ncbi:unnamed protein product [Arabis nemorensis]|uniref:BHLH domain-containing protein n=1 Tax=Arabis nemorensis TaxID=586526 RepID=A0A565AMF6_9BRAS|nr:unnamed protein product [Arabis nemorensis]
MGLGWRNHVGSLPVKDQGVSERARTDEDRLINGLKWNYDYFDHDRHTDIHVQIVPELHKEEEKSEKDLLVVVPDEHSETGDYHLSEDYSDSSDNRWFLRNKHDKPKRRRIQISSDDESEGFTREVPSVTRGGSKRRKRRRDEMSNKMLTLQQLVPNCHKTDKVSVLDKAIEYMKNLQLQLQVMSAMGTNPYIPPATLNFGMYNHHLLTAMAMAHGLNPANQMVLPPLIPPSNWPLPPFTSLSFPHSSSSPQPLYGLVPCFPSFLDFSGRL